MPVDTEKQKVYSPDITPYSMEGRSGVFGTLLSIIVAPVRIVSRIMHNIFVLPANMLESYARSLLYISLALLLCGIVDFVVVGRWPLVVSQIPCIYYAIRLRSKARKSTIVVQKKREVDMNDEAVDELTNTVIDELNKVVEDE